MDDRLAAQIGEKLKGETRQFSADEMQAGLQGVKIGLLIDFLSYLGAAWKAFEIFSQVILDRAETAVGLIKMGVGERQMLAYYPGDRTQTPGPAVF